MAREATSKPPDDRPGGGLTRLQGELPLAAPKGRSAAKRRRRGRGPRGPRRLRGYAAQRDGAPIRETASAIYRPLFSKSILNENTNLDLPFRWTINPYRGCEIGCTYCYARFTHELMEHRRVDDFSRKIYVKVDAGVVLREQLRPGMLKGKPVAIGTATDPYQPAESRFEITRKILQVLAGQPDLDLSITTKSPLILRDLDLLTSIAEHRPLRINVSLITTSPRLSRLLDPAAPLPLRRLRAVRRLAQSGLHVNVLVMPVLPGITDGRHEIEALLKAARKAGASGAYANVLHLRGADRRSFWPVLRNHFPHLVKMYEAFYRNGPYAPESYRKLIAERFEGLRKKAGFPDGPPDRVYVPLPGDQMDLGFCGGGGTSERIAV